MVSVVVYLLFLTYQASKTEATTRTTVITDAALAITDATVLNVGIASEATPSCGDIIKKCHDDIAVIIVKIGQCYFLLLLSLLAE